MDDSLPSPIQPEIIEALMWIAIWGGPSERNHATRTLLSWGITPPDPAPRLSGSPPPPPPTQLAGARYRGNFGSPSDAHQYAMDAGIPEEYIYIDEHGNLWIWS